MAKAWTDKREYQRLTSELATAVDRDFERKVLPILRVIWPAAIPAPARRAFDRKGVDHLVWSDTEPFPLVVQCKGFETLEHELGESQVRQCLESIESFKRSGLRTSAYVLVHNRLGKNQELRHKVEPALLDLIAAGRASTVELLDRQRFLTKAFNAMLARVRAALAQQSLSRARFQAELEPQPCEPVTQVPLQSSDLVADQYRLISSKAGSVRLADPSAEILAAGEGQICVVIGEAGFGKTIAALRTFSNGHRQILYAPAAGISEATVSTKDLLQQCVELDELFGDSPAEDRRVLELMARPAIEYLLKDAKTGVALILDGLDESAFLSRRGGLQLLVNLLRPVRVPVVLLARTEFWRTRQVDFATSFGEIAKSPKARRRRVRLVELLPWDDEQMLLLGRRYRESVVKAAGRRRLGRLLRLIEDGSYGEYYGDIPRRPLFLAFLLAWVAERGVKPVDRAKLLRDVVQMKILRDIGRPLAGGRGGSGRSGIRPEGESADTTVELAWLAMEWASFRMTTVRDGIMELMPACLVGDVLAADPRFGGIVDPTGVLLNSMLVPIPRETPGEALRVRFGHRVLQEFFLAEFLRKHPDRLVDLQLPPPVDQWLRSNPNNSQLSRVVDPIAESDG